MKKTIKRKAPPLEAPAEELNIADLIYKVQQQLVYLEKKMDTLIAAQAAQAAQKSTEPKTFSKPFQHFDRPHHGGGRPDNNFRERNLFRTVCAQCQQECEVPFKPTGDRPVYCKDCFSKRNDRNERSEGGSFQGRHDKPRGESFSHGRPFNKHHDKHQGSDNRKPGRRKKSAF